MTERWREKLGALGRAEPDETKLRSLAAAGPRMPEPSPGGGSRVLAGIVALVVAVSAFGLLIATFRDDTDDRAATALDPAAICKVPAYDPDVALLVGQPVREVALSSLEAPGQPASELRGPATDALRAYLASAAAVHAPAEGWRPVEVRTEAVAFAAPDDPSRWWVVGFTRQPDGNWRQVEEEIVDQAQTPAQRGHDLRLVWSGDLILDAATWNDALGLVNDRDARWTDAGSRLWGVPHVFDRATGQEVVSPLPVAGGSREPYELGSGQEISLPLALGGVLPELTSGTFDMVACVPELGLASPVVELAVRDTGAVPDVRVLTYPGPGTGMLALASGTLTVTNGCLAVDEASQPIYVLWPDGYTLVERDGRRVLIDPIGAEVAAPGDSVTLGGGYVELRWIDDMLTGKLPDACRAPGESYFVTSGLAETQG